MLDKQRGSSETRPSPWRHDTCRCVTRVNLKFVHFNKRWNAGCWETVSNSAVSYILNYINCNWLLLRCGRTGPGGRMRGRGNRERRRLSVRPERRQSGESEGRRWGGSRRQKGRRRWCSRRWWDYDVRWRRGEAWSSWFDTGTVSEMTLMSDCIYCNLQIPVMDLMD